MRTNWLQNALKLKSDHVVLPMKINLIKTMESIRGLDSRPPPLFPHYVLTLIYGALQLESPATTRIAVRTPVLQDRATRATDMPTENGYLLQEMIL